MDNKIDLGSKMEPMGAMAPEPVKGSSKEPKVSYPTLYAHKSGKSEKDGFGDLPKDDLDFHGHGRVVSHEHRITKDKDGKETHHHRMELEVHHITPHSTKGEKTGGEGEPSDPGESLEGELNKIERKKSKPSGKENETEE